jgi:hypothetical protein
MKIKLLLLLFLTALISFAQNPISSFYGVNNSVFSLLTSAGTLDHSPTGANQTWTFTQLSNSGTSLRNNNTPTSAETTTYPGTTTVILFTNTQGTNVTTGNLYTKDQNGTVSITGLTSSELVANFVTNNATLGSFPMAYTFTNSDPVAGTYVYTTYSGTFTGTLVTSVDAYGTLTLNDAGDGTGSYTGTVTRLKTVLNLSLNYQLFSNVGTVTQTTYSYYDGNATGTNNPIFRSITTSAVVPLLSINQTETSLEKFKTVLLSVKNPILESVWIKNPVENTIEINTSYTIDNASISITDMLGKTIYQVKNQNISGTFEIPVSINKGIYLITISNENGNVTKKIVKG